MGIILKKQLTKNVLEVRRVSDKMIKINAEVEEERVNTVSAYAQQVECNRGEQENFWSGLDAVMQGISKKERVMIEAYLNGNVVKEIGEMKR